MINLLSTVPEIKTLTEKKLAGLRISMSFSNDKTHELWRSFMPRRKEIRNNINADLYSMQIYPPLFFDSFSQGKEFEKWATVEVSDFNNVPPDLETFLLPAGLYAVFVYKGSAADAAPSFQYIMGTWLPGSGYVLDTRPHFEILGDKYKNNDPASEEELWIPVKPK